MYYKTLDSQMHINTISTYQCIVELTDKSTITLMTTCLYCKLAFSVFEETTNEFYEQGPEMINSKNDMGKRPVDLACILGRTDILQELIKRGIDPNSSNTSGNLI